MNEYASIKKWKDEHDQTTQKKLDRYEALMSKYIVGKCPTCNYMACWPVCTKCGTPYPPEDKDE